MKKLLIVFLLFMGIVSGLTFNALIGLSTASAYSSSKLTSIPEKQLPKIHIFPRKGAYPSNAASANLLYNGGPILTSPQVYVTYWGWTSDPSGEASYVENFLRGQAGSSWLNTVTQYHNNSQAYILNSPIQFGGSWYDNSNPAPQQPTQSQLAQEAQASAAHFGYNANAVYFIATATGHSSSGFGSSYCAWHSWTTNANASLLSYVNLPYITDAGASCGENSVNSGSAGLLDGVSIVTGHEYAETITDPQLNAWYDGAVAEIGDKCAWIFSGQGALQNIGLSTGTFAMQSLWDNSLNGGAGGCAQSHFGSTALTVTPTDFVPSQCTKTSLGYSCKVTLTATSSASQGNVYWTSNGASNPFSGTLLPGQSVQIVLGPFGKYERIVTFSAPQSASATVDWVGYCTYRCP